MQIKSTARKVVLGLAALLAGCGGTGSAGTQVNLGKIAIKGNANLKQGLVRVDVEKQNPIIQAGASGETYRDAEAQRIAAQRGAHKNTEPYFTESEKNKENLSPFERNYRQRNN
jgi:hypothetical protein